MNPSRGMADPASELKAGEGEEEAKPFASDPPQCGQADNSGWWMMRSLEYDSFEFPISVRVAVYLGTKVRLREVSKSLT